jgi:hypothetical protein
VLKKAIRRMRAALNIYLQPIPPRHGTLAGC